MCIPNAVPELNDRLLVLDINNVLRMKLDDDTRLVLAAAEHDSTGDLGVRTDVALLREWNELLARAEDDDIVLAAGTARRMLGTAYEI